MFIYDRPIEKLEDDILGRKGFSEHLADSIQNWREEESLVISLDSEWGAGKSSVINMALHYIEKNVEIKPTIFEFNPWAYSDVGNITTSFFNELAKELQIKDKAKRDKKLADKLKAYAHLLGATPDKTNIKNLFDKIGLTIGLLGIGGISLSSFLKAAPNWVKITLFSVGVIFVLLQLFKDQLLKFSSYYEHRSKVNEKTLNELKNEIKEDLLKRSQKLLIIIDDLDRLAQNEIKQILRLIRVNADFPNTVYLLAYDRDIVEKNLDDQLGVSGKNYLDKIVQVSFNLPEVRQTKIHQFLFSELDRILGAIEAPMDVYFGESNVNWTNLFHSGYKDFFENLRDVKRYISSLEFNIKMLYRNNVLEVNPIDFIAIEAIRVFVPNFYNFIKKNNQLFTSTEDETSRRGENPRQEQLRDALLIVPEKQSNIVEELIKRLFPQAGNVLERGYSGYSSFGHGWQQQWGKELKICSSKHFESYFALKAGGDESEISLYEMGKILESMSDQDKLESELKIYLDQGKIRKVLARLQDYTDDIEKIPPEYTANIIQALFNIADDLPTENEGMFDFGADIDIIRITYQLLKRQSDKKAENFQILYFAISQSKSLYAAVQRVSFNTPSADSKERIDVLEESDVVRLQQLCIEKIIEFEDKGLLLSQSRLTYILYRWKEWDQAERWKHFITKCIKDNDEPLFTFLNHFISVSLAQTMGDYGSRKIKNFNMKSFKDFVEDIDAIKQKVEMHKSMNSYLYQKYQLCIDMFLLADDEIY